MGAALTPDPKKPFLSDIKEIRRRARQHMERGAVTENYKADLETSLRVLNEALATELVCVLRYKRHYFMASGIHAQAVADEFLEHADEEQGHADQIAARRAMPTKSPPASFNSMARRISIPKVC